MPHASRATRRAFSALRIQFFELSRVGRAFAYGDSIDAAAFGTGSSAVKRRGSSRRNAPNTDVGPDQAALTEHRRPGFDLVFRLE